MTTSPVILITGASSGIGAATARLFAAQGYQVVLAARRFDRLQALADEIEAQGGQALPVTTDISQTADIQALVDTTIACCGGIDILFNNAGFGRLDWLENLDPVEDIQAQVQVNLLGLIYTARAVLPHMIERRRGHIINMASVAGLVAMPTYSVYAATKFAVRGFGEALRREVGIYGIRVSTIYPGGVATEFSQRARLHKRKSGYTTPARLRLSAEDVAQGVLKLSRRPRRSLIIPGPMRLAFWANALLPGLVDRLVESRFVSTERG